MYSISSAMCDWLLFLHQAPSGGFPRPLAGRPSHLPSCVCTVSRREHGPVVAPTALAQSPVVPDRRLVLRRVVWWLVGSAVGVGIVALPDAGPRVFSLSDTHGPSLVDVLGIVVLVAAWAPIVVMLWQGRHVIAARGPAPLALAIVGAVVLVVTISFDLGPTWTAGVALLFAAQIVALRRLLMTGAREEGGSGATT
jgi:hypothetical protein